MVRRGSDDGNRLAAAKRYARMHSEILSQLEVLVMEREASGSSPLGLTLSDLSSPRNGEFPVAARSTIGVHFPSGGITQALAEVAAVMRQRGQDVPRSLTVAESMQREYERGRAAESASIFDRIRGLDHEMGGDPLRVLDDAIFLKVDPKYIFAIVERIIARPRRWDWYEPETKRSADMIDRAIDSLDQTVKAMKRPRTQLLSDERYEDLRPILSALWNACGRKGDGSRQVSPNQLRSVIPRAHRIIEDALLPLPDELWTSLQWSRLLNQFRTEHLATLTADSGEQEVSRLLELTDRFTRIAFNSMSPSTKLDDTTNFERAALAQQMLRALAVSDLAYSYLRPGDRREMAARVVSTALLWIDPDSSVPARIAWAYALMLRDSDVNIEDIGEILLDDFGEGFLAVFALRSKADRPIAQHLAQLARKEQFWSALPGAFGQLAERIQGVPHESPRRPPEATGAAPVRLMIRAHIRSVISDMLAGKHAELLHKLSLGEYEARVLMFYGAELRAELPQPGADDDLNTGRGY